MNKSILQNSSLLSLDDGIHDTFLNSVKVFKTSTYEPRTPLIYDVSLILVLQGKKIANLVNTSITFDCDNYLVVPTTLPLECETYASKDEPFVALIISLNKEMMIEIIDKLSKKEFEQKRSSLGIFNDKVTNPIEQCTAKLLDILNSFEESMILGDAILKELFYRICIGENADFLHKMFLENNNEAKIARALKKIHENFGKDIDIPSLARLEDMSVSSFHTHFKKITSHTPLQYIKKIKLSKARDLILKHNYQVVDAAYELGYDNPSQFSRDFKLYFGYPPKETKNS